MYIKVMCLCFYLSNFDSDTNYLSVLRGLHTGQRGDAGMNDDNLLWKRLFLLCIVITVSHCCSSFPLYLIFSPGTLKRTPMFGSQTVSLLSQQFWGLRFHYLRWECVRALGGGNAIWKICKRNCLSMNVGSHLPKERGGEVVALEFSISGVINRACVWQGVLCEPRAGHWEPSKPRGKRRKQLFLQKGSSLPLGGWKGSDCKAGGTELSSLQVACPAACPKSVHQQRPFWVHGEVLVWRIKQSLPPQTTSEPLPRGAFSLQLAGSQLTGVLLWWWRASEHPWILLLRV